MSSEKIQQYTNYLWSEVAFSWEFPIPRKKIPIPGILNPMGFLPKSVGSQSREFPGIFENPRDFGNSQKIQKMKKNPKMSKNEKKTLKLENPKNAYYY